MKILDGMIQGSDEWKKLRYSKIGCSDLSVIMGINPWKTPYQLWREKILQIDTPDNEDMKRGRENEAAALAYWNSDVPQEPAIPIVALSDQYDWFMGSFDGWDGKSAIEIKCPRKQHKLIPDYYVPQLQGLMAISDTKSAFFMSWCNDVPAYFAKDRDQAYIDEMLLKAKEFYDHLINFVPPPMGKGDFVDTDEDDDYKKMAEHLIIARKQRQDAEDQESKAKVEIVKYVLGKSYHSAKGCGVRVTKVLTKGRIDYDAIPELKGIDLEKYRGETKESWRVS